MELLFFALVHSSDLCALQLCWVISHVLKAGRWTCSPSYTTLLFPGNLAKLLSVAVLSNHFWQTWQDYVSRALHNMLA